MADTPSTPMSDYFKGRVSQVKPDEDAFGKWPTLAGLMTEESKDGKIVLQGGNIRITKSSGYLWVTMTRPTEGLQCKTAVNSLVDLFDALELFLSSPDCIWDQTYEAKKKSLTGAKLIR